MGTKKLTYDKQAILDATNGGKEIIARLCPKAFKGQNLNPNHFKLREGDENTGSCIPYCSNGVWRVQSFGASPTLDVFSLIIELEPNVTSFVEALQWAGREFSVSGGSSKFNSAKIEFKDATAKQKHGDYFYDYRKNLTDFELKTLGVTVTQKVCDFYNVKSVNSFTQIKQYKEGDKGFDKYGSKAQQIITHASDSYPIFIIDGGGFQKIYQPLNKDKGFRFRYAPIGNKSASHIFGLAQAAQTLQDYKANYVLEDGERYEDVKLPYLIIGGGDRDSLNIAGCDYPVVWFNSETADFSYTIYKQLHKLAHKVVLCGDIDATGIKEMYKKALELIHLYILELPSWIKEHSYRDSPRKDVKDFIDLTYSLTNDADSCAKAFDKLVKNALPARFWDVIKDKDGNFKKYTINNEAVFRFLKYNGYYRIEERDAKDDYGFVQLTNNVITRKNPHEIADFPYNWLNKKNHPIALLNTVIRSAQLTDKKLSKLTKYEPNLKDSSETHQLLFFDNYTWKVTAKEITTLRYDSNNLDTQVWKDKIIPQSPTYQTDPYFKIDWLDGAYTIDILKKDNPFLNFLINSSRVHWRDLGNDPFLDKRDSIDNQSPELYKAALANLDKEYQKYHDDNRFNISEAKLDPLKIQEQVQHLVSKIYIIGYLMHTYKSPSKAWQVHVMDNRISDTGQSNGGSGKSLSFNVCLRSLQPATHFIDGKDLDPQKDSFVYDGVTRDTNLVVIDDLNPKYPISKFFNRTTADFAVNPKGATAYTLTYDESPKIITLSNYGNKDDGGSATRRVRYWVASDYYHGDDDTCYKVEHQPKEDIGIELIKGFDTKQHSDFINFMAQCLKFYLAQSIPIKAPNSNIIKRNALEKMGDEYFNWAEIYFSPQDDATPSKKLNTYLVKKDMFLHCKEVTGYARLSPNNFKTRLEQWCKYKGYTLNPRKLLEGKKFLKKYYNDKTTELFYIQTTGAPLKNYHATNVYNEANEVFDSPLDDANNMFTNQINPADGDFPT